MKKEIYNKLNGKIKTWRKPYDLSFSPTRPKEVQFKPGVTVLVGCNGAGKTTLIKTIKERCEKNHVPCIDFDNYHDGGSQSIGSALFYGNIDFAASMITSSEGEKITHNVMQFARKIGQKVRYEYTNAEEIWIAFDATDSGLSIDNVIDLKEFFQFLLDEENEKELYIIVSANEYEMCIDLPCMDVSSGKYVDFPTYESYKKFILKSREIKNRHYEKEK